MSLRNEIEELLHAALYDSSGEMVEGGLVDRYESKAEKAIDALLEHFALGGFGDKESAVVLASVREAAAPPEASVRLLSRLGRRALPVIEILRKSQDPAHRAIAAGAAIQILDPKDWIRSAKDPNAHVRATALEKLSESKADFPEAQDCFRYALSDESPFVRRIAARSVRFFNDPAGQLALLTKLREEPDESVRHVIFKSVAEKTRAEGVSHGHQQVAQGIGPEIRQILIELLASDQVEFRRLAALAMERLRGPDVAGALAERLRVEEESKIREILVLFNGYYDARQQALPLITETVRSDPSPLMRTRAAFLLEGFAAEAVLPLIGALKDEDPNVCRAATMSIAKSGGLAAIPFIIELLQRPDCRFFTREIESSLTELVLNAPPDLRPIPTSEISTFIRKEIAAIEAEGFGAWPVRVCKEQLNALPIHSNLIYMWAIRPDGKIVWLDHEAFGNQNEEETDPLTQFAVIVDGARKYPELTLLIPTPPKSARVCLECSGLGWRESNGQCMSCNGLGWYRAN